MSDSLQHCGPARLLFSIKFPGKNTGEGCHFLLQGIFLTQGLNLHLLHWQADSLRWATREAPTLLPVCLVEFPKCSLLIICICINKQLLFNINRYFGLIIKENLSQYIYKKSMKTIRAIYNRLFNWGISDDRADSFMHLITNW